MANNLNSRTALVEALRQAAEKARLERNRMSEASQAAQALATQPAPSPGLPGAFPRPELPQA